MGSKSDYAENSTLTTLLGDGTGKYLALCTVAPTDASTGSTLTEASYTGYARASLAAKLGTASGGSKTNTADIVFADCTAGSSVVVGFAICDAPTGGNSLYWGTMTSKTIDTSNTPPTVKAGQLTITED